MEFIVICFKGWWNKATETLCARCCAIWNWIGMLKAFVRLALNMIAHSFRTIYNELNIQISTEVLPFVQTLTHIHMHRRPNLQCKCTIAHWDENAPFLCIYLFILIKTSQEVTIPCFMFDDYAILISIKVYADFEHLMWYCRICAMLYIHMTYRFDDALSFQTIDNNDMWKHHPKIRNYRMQWDSNSNFSMKQRKSSLAWSSCANKTRTKVWALRFR